MFKVSNHLCKIVSVTNVSEKHGRERKPAISIGLYLVGGGDLLDQFDTALRPAIYRKPHPTPGELPMEHAQLSELRFPFMRNFAWDRKYAGYILRFHIGATGSEDVLLAECGLKDIRFVAQEGGNIGVAFKVKRLTRRMKPITARLQRACSRRSSSRSRRRIRCRHCSMASSRTMRAIHSKAATSRATKPKRPSNPEPRTSAAFGRPS